MANSDQMQENVVIRAVSLYPEDWQEVDELARERGVGASAAVRMIIREWRERIRERYVITGPIGSGG